MFDWLFGSGRQTNYDDTNKLYGQFDQAKNQATNFYNDKIANTDWDSLDLATKASLSQEYNNLNTAARGYESQYGAMNDAYNQENKSTKNDYFGNGILGALLNPFAQTFTAAGDLMSGQYDQKGRDVASDLGALGESALSLVPFAGGAMKALKLGKAGAAVSRGVNSIPGMAAVGAGFGGLEAVRQGGSETQLQDVLSQAGMGAAFGGGIPLAGKLLKGRGTKVLSNQMANRGMDQQAISQTMGAIPNRALYSSAMRSFVPRSTFGKIAAGAGAVAGGGMLMNGMGGQQPTMDGQMTEEQLYNYLISQGAM